MKAPPPTREAIELLRDGSRVLARITANGVRIDVDHLDRASKTLGKRIVRLTRELHRDPVWKAWVKRYGPKADLGKLQQLAVVIFDDLGHPCKARTAPTAAHPNGLPKVDEKALARLDLPFLRKFRQLRKAEKVKGTYLDGLRKEVVDGYLHPDFNLWTAKTYRSSSSNPNWQNLPVRDEDSARWVRAAIVPRPGRHFGEIDFKGIEVAIGYCYHLDPAMGRYIREDPGRMHKDAAADLFLLKLKQVSDAVRVTAKGAFVFASFYGSFWAQTAPALWEAAATQTVEGTGITLREHLRGKGIDKLGSLDPKREPEEGTFSAHVREAERVLWQERFPGYAKWKKDWVEACRERGWMRTKTGFVISLATGGDERNRGEFDRTGEGGLAMSRNDITNYPIQGSAFHCLLWVLIRLQEWLDANDMKTLIVGQMHDSINFDAPPDEVGAFLNEVERIITEDLPRAWPWIVVPLKVDVAVADVDRSWHEKRKWARSDRGWGPKETA